jgi:hypothetical protein
MVPHASLLRPWLTTSSSSDSESSTRFHHSLYLVTLLISLSILSGPTFPIVVFSRSSAPEESGGNTDSIDGTAFTVCPKMLKQLLKRTCNTSAPGLDGIRWRELKIWFKLDPKGLCQILNELIKTGLPPELKVARVVVVVKPGRRDRTKVKSYRYISLLPTIGKLVEKAITLHLANQGEFNGWWHPGQHGSRAGRNTTDALLWIIRRVRENRQNKKHTAVLMVDVSAAFPNTSRNEVRETLKNADLGIA